jgi:3'-phosphoadenosine 5'-phosphosulfate sulfotransferase (PAPS reductase)/FAD synthetase
MTFDIESKVASAHRVIDDAIAQYNPRKVFALFSGGHDSASTTHVVAQHPAFSGVIHINTGISVPESNEYVREICAEYGWPLYELRAGVDGGSSYLQLVVQDGFPGAGVHSIFYRELKEKPLEAFLAKVRKGIPDEPTKSGKGRLPKRIALCGGTRSQESVRRMGNVEVCHVRGANVWLAPIHDWTALDTTDYMAAVGMRRNPVKDRLHISGECLCGCFADALERREIEFWYPEVHEELQKYERVVEHVCALDLRGHGIKGQYRQWAWHDGVANEQQELFPLCHYCYAGRLPDQYAAHGAVKGGSGEKEAQDEEEDEAVTALEQSA